MFLHSMDLRQLSMYLLQLHVELIQLLRLSLVKEDLTLKLLMLNILDPMIQENHLQKQLLMEELIQSVNQHLLHLMEVQLHMLMKQLQEVADHT